MSFVFGIFDFTDTKEHTSNTPINVLKNMPYCFPKCKVENCFKVTTSSLKLRNTKCLKLDNQVFDLTTTNCNFGGVRHWFICTCRRRVAILYKPYFADTWACRHCYNLTYESRNLSGKFKAIGNPLSVPELEAMSSQVARVFYNGKPTKKFTRLEKKMHQFETYHSAWLKNFYKGLSQCKS